jgi:hypothetical protein
MRLDYTSIALSRYVWHTFIELTLFHTLRFTVSVAAGVWRLSSLSSA